MATFTAKQVKEGALNEDYLYAPYEFTVSDSEGNTFHVECAQKEASMYGDNDPAEDRDAAKTYTPFNHWEGEDLICDYCHKAIHPIYRNEESEQE